MAEKRDFLGECSADIGGTPQDVLANCCFRCLQPECVRSQHGKSMFEGRIATWEDRLFHHVPRMTEGDPRLVVLQSKKFVEIPGGPIPEIGRRSTSAWVDPRELDAAPESPHSTASSGPPVASPPPAVPEPTEAPVAQAAPEPLPEPAPPAPAPRTQFINTQVQPGRMIGGRKPEAQQDPWEVRPTETKGLPVVQPGTRIKFGGPGV